MSGLLWYFAREAHGKQVSFAAWFQGSQRGGGSTVWLEGVTECVRYILLTMYLSSKKQNKQEKNGHCRESHFKVLILILQGKTKWLSNTLWEELIKRMGGGLGADSVWPSMAPRASPQSTMRTDRNPGRGTSLVCCSVLPGRHIGYREEGRSRGWGQSVEGEGSVWKEVYIGKIFSEPLLKKQKTQKNNYHKLEESTGPRNILSTKELWKVLVLRM